MIRVITLSFLLGRLLLSQAQKFFVCFFLFVCFIIIIYFEHLEA